MDSTMEGTWLRKGRQVFGVIAGDGDERFAEAR
jgi:hypothetical protein